MYCNNIVITIDLCQSDFEETNKLRSQMHISSGTKKTQIYITIEFNLKLACNTLLLLVLELKFQSRDEIMTLV